MNPSDVPLGQWLSNLVLMDRCPGGCGGAYVYSAVESPDGTWRCGVVFLERDGSTDATKAIVFCAGVSREAAIAAAESHRIAIRGEEYH